MGLRLARHTDVFLRFPVFCSNVHVDALQSADCPSKAVSRTAFMVDGFRLNYESDNLIRQRLSRKSKNIRFIWLKNKRCYWLRGGSDGSLEYACIKSHDSFSWSSPSLQLFLVLQTFVRFITCLQICHDLSLPDINRFILYIGSFIGPGAGSAVS